MWEVVKGRESKGEKREREREKERERKKRKERREMDVVGERARRRE